MTSSPLLHFVTSNPGKLKEARSLLPVPVEGIDLDLVEIQSSSLELISLQKLAQARLHVDGPVFVEDVALGFNALGGFPGPYVKWLLTAAGGVGLGSIAAGLGDTSALATCHLAYWNGSTVRSFVGECRGRIVSSARGKSGFGWDAWFLPDGRQLTYAEMSEAEKATISHRAMAYAQLSAFLLSGA